MVVCACGKDGRKSIGIADCCMKKKQQVLGRDLNFCKRG
jgi:hypothetical protein